jgi:hypothetical protein
MLRVRHAPDRSSRRRILSLVVLVPLVLIAATSLGQPQVLFDDFSVGVGGLRQHGWTIRAKPGWPGIPGATWSSKSASVVRGSLRLTSSTDGAAAGTTQAQVCQQRKFLAGTYAARVRFSDSPVAGPDGDRLVETFYAISPLVRPLDPNYSELDWEYLPNGGWGRSASTLYMTSWETAQLEPWIAVNSYDTATRSLNGWHTLVLQVGNGRMTYYLDRVRLATHGRTYYPEVPMSINFNLWFIRGGLLSSRKPRRYTEDVDWVYHRAGVVLSPRAALAEVARLRRARVAFRDTVPAASPPLASPCSL